MARTDRRAPGWRAAFLRALARGGSVTGAARAAGVDKGTAYDARNRDAAFKAEWVRVKAEAQARLGAGETPELGDDEIVRASRSGRPCVVRAGPGRWSAGRERTFLEELATDANVRRAARAAGVSTATVYTRRTNWPGFAERWAAALEQGYARLEMLLVQQATATLSGEPVAGGEGEDGGGPGGGGAMPTFAEAMNLFRLHRQGVTGAGRRPGPRPAEPSPEELHAELLRRIRAMGG